MSASHENGRWYLAAAAAALAGLVLLWAGGEGKETSSTPGVARAAVLGPAAADSDLVVEMVVRGRLPPATPPAAPETGKAAGTIPEPSGFDSTAVAADGPSPANLPVGAVGMRAQPSRTHPRRFEVREASPRRGRTPALRESEPPAGRISDRTLRSILGRKRSALEACYHGARALDPSLEGEVTFALTVRPAGTVEVELLDRSPALEQAGVIACIRERLEALDFTATPPQGGELHLRVPMSFVRVPEPVPFADV